MLIVCWIARRAFDRLLSHTFGKDTPKRESKSSVVAFRAKFSLGLFEWVGSARISFTDKVGLSCHFECRMVADSTEDSTYAFLLLLKSPNFPNAVIRAQSSSQSIALSPGQKKYCFSSSNEENKKDVKNVEQKKSGRKTTATLCLWKWTRDQKTKTTWDWITFAMYYWCLYGFPQLVSFPDLLHRH